MKTMQSMPLRRALIIPALLTLVWLIGGCTSVPLAPLAENTEAKRFEPVEGKALVYLYRDTSALGCCASEISINGKVIGKTAAYTFFLIETPPGNLSIVSSEEPGSSFVSNHHELQMEVAAGRVYYVSQEAPARVLIIPLTVELKLLERDEPSGKKGVADSKLISRVKL